MLRRSVVLRCFFGGELFVYETTTVFDKLVIICFQEGWLFLSVVALGLNIRIVILLVKDPTGLIKSALFKN